MPSLPDKVIGFVVENLSTMCLFVSLTRCILSLCSFLSILENINPTENAISAVTKILQYNGSACHMDQILPVWLVLWSRSRLYVKKAQRHAM